MVNDDVVSSARVRQYVDWPMRSRRVYRISDVGNLGKAKRDELSENLKLFQNDKVNQSGGYQSRGKERQSYERFRQLTVVVHRAREVSTRGG